MKPLAPGPRGAWRALPEFTDSAAAAGNTGVAVVSSQALIAWCEQAAHRAIADYHEPGEATLGVGFDLAHVAPARLDREVVAEAEVVAVEGRRITFEVRPPRTASRSCTAATSAWWSTSRASSTRPACRRRCKPRAMSAWNTGSISTARGAISPATASARWRGAMASR